MTTYYAARRRGLPDYFTMSKERFEMLRGGLAAHRFEFKLLNDETHHSITDLTRELDVLWNGDKAAKQASLCDIVAQIAKELPALRERLQMARTVIKENHDWHKNYDEFDGYGESELYEMNANALAELEE